MPRLLSHSQLQEIARIVEDYHNALTYMTLGPDYLDDEDAKRLRAKGLIDPEAAENYPELAYMFGRILEDIGDEEAISLSYADFLKYLRDNPPLLDMENRATIDVIQREFHHDIEKLTDRVEVDVKRTILDGEDDLRRKLKTARKKMTVGVEKRQTAEQIGREIERATGDYTSDWFKLTATRVTEAGLEGRAEQIATLSELGQEARVFKRPRPDACKWCADLYLMPDKKTPKVFTLSEMHGFGRHTRGTRKEEWRPVVGPVHPWCACTLHELPPGFGFDENGQMVLLHGEGPGTINA